MRPRHTGSRLRSTALDGGGRGAVVGHKIGCTTPVMQAYLDIPNPCAGEVFARTIHRGVGAIREPGTPCGSASSARLPCCSAADLDARAVARNRVGDAVGAVMASIEVVDDRYVD